MKCKYDNNTIIAYIEGQLSDSDGEKFKEHLKSCERCAKKIKVLTYTKSYFSQDIKTNQSLSNNVMNAIDKSRYRDNTMLTKTAQIFYKNKPIWKTVFPVVAAILLVVLLLGYSNNSYIVNIKDSIVAGIKQAEPKKDNINNNEIVDLETPTQSSITTPIPTLIPTPKEESDETNKVFEANSELKDFSKMENFLVNVDFSVEEKAIEQFKYQYIVRGSFDVNGDERLDQISCVLNQNGESTLKVNDVSISFYQDNPTNDSVKILDFDKSDNYKEIIIFDLGASDDLRYDCFRYDGKEVINLGTIKNPLMDGYGRMITGRIEFITPNILTAWAEIKDNEIKNYNIDISSIKNKEFVIAYDFEAYFIERNDQNNFTKSWEREYEQNFKKGDKIIIKDTKESNVYLVPSWYFVELQNGKTGILYFFMGD